MFFGLPLEPQSTLQKTVLILNTILLLAALVVLELIYAEKPKEHRKHLRYFLPVMGVLVGLLLYTAYRQMGGTA
jgi:hypothetical protein